MESKNSVVQYENAHPRQTCAKLFLDEETADVHFLVGDGDTQKRVPAHKIILAKASVVFHSMFYGGFKRQNDIEIVDVYADGFEKFLQFFYLDRVDVSMEYVEEIMYLADKYILRDCLKICEQFLLKNLKVKNICFVDELAIKHHRDELKALCETKIRENPTKLFASDEFRDTTRDVLKHILTMDKLGCDGKTLFDACMIWSAQKCVDAGLPVSVENRRKMLDDCIYYIPFGSMTSAQVFECIKNFRGFFSQEELEEIMLIVHSDTPMTLNKFKCISYNSKNLLQEFSRETDECRDVRMSATEETFLQTTEKISLCAIATVDLVGEPLTMSGTMTISAANKNDHKLLLKQYVEITNKNYIKLEKALVFEPNVLYKIKIDFGTGWKGGLTYNRKLLRDKIDVDENFKISFFYANFHPRFDLISKFYYKQ